MRHRAQQDAAGRAVSVGPQDDEVVAPTLGRDAREKRGEVDQAASARALLLDLWE
jgi:hypothetical protein